MAIPPRKEVRHVGGLKRVVLAHRRARVYRTRIPAGQALTVVISAREDAKAVLVVVVGLVAVEKGEWDALWAHQLRANLKLGRAADLRLREEPEAIVRRALRARDSNAHL